MNDEAYGELVMELSILRGRFVEIQEELDARRIKYYELVAEIQEVVQRIEQHDAICPLGGM